MRTKRYLTLALCAAGISMLLAGNSLVLAAEAKASAETAGIEAEDSDTSAVLEDGVYSAKFDTDSSMFHVNEANDGRGTLTVKDGKMSIHVSLVSKSILNLFPGTAEDAQKEGAKLLEPTTDTVTYSDGLSEEVYGFDISVPALDEEFDVALIGKKEKWYDHKVTVTDPRPEDSEGTADGKDTADGNDTTDSKGVAVADLKLADGSYTVEAVLDGGSGRATVESPAVLTVKDGEAVAEIVWSSPYYDYMLVDGEKYEPVNTEGNSTFEIPVAGFDCEISVTADTVAMSAPHEIDYTVHFDSASIKKAE